MLRKLLLLPLPALIGAGLGFLYSFFDFTKFELDTKGWITVFVFIFNTLIWFIKAVFYTGIGGAIGFGIGLVWVYFKDKK